MSLSSEMTKKLAIALAVVAIGGVLIWFGVRSKNNQLSGTADTSTVEQADRQVPSVDTRFEDGPPPDAGVPPAGESPTGAPAGPVQ